MRQARIDTLSEGGAPDQAEWHNPALYLVYAAYQLSLANIKQDSLEVFSRLQSYRCFVRMQPSLFYLVRCLTSSALTESLLETIIVQPACLLSPAQGQT